MLKVSIIIPTRNRARLLLRAVDSARRAGTTVEIIVVDDASTDETPAVCQSVSDIRYFRLDRNRGQAEARNVGIRHSTADYLHFLDDDDVMLPGSLDGLVQCLERDSEAAFVYGQIKIGDQDCVPTGPLFPQECPEGDIFWDLLLGNFIMVHAVVARKQHCLDAGLFNARVTGVEDWDLWLRLAEQRRVLAANIPIGIVRSANGLSGQTTSNHARMSRLSARVQAQALRLVRARAASPILRRQIRRDFLDRVADTLIWDAPEAIATGMTHYARANLLTALRLNPRRAGHLVTFTLLIMSFCWDLRKLRHLMSSVVRKHASRHAGVSHARDAFMNSGISKDQTASIDISSASNEMR